MSVKTVIDAGSASLIGFARGRLGRLRQRRADLGVDIQQEITKVGGSVVLVRSHLDQEVIRITGGQRANLYPYPIFAGSLPSKNASGQAALITTRTGDSITPVVLDATNDAMKFERVKDANSIAVPRTFEGWTKARDTLLRLWKANAAPMLRRVLFGLCGVNIAALTSVGVAVRGLANPAHGKITWAAFNYERYNSESREYELVPTTGHVYPIAPFDDTLGGLIYDENRNDFRIFLPVYSNASASYPSAVQFPYGLTVGSGVSYIAVWLKDFMLSIDRVFEGGFVNKYVPVVDGSFFDATQIALEALGQSIDTYAIVPSPSGGPFDYDQTHMMVFGSVGSTVGYESVRTDVRPWMEFRAALVDPVINKSVLIRLSSVYNAVTDAYSIGYTVEDGLYENRFPGYEAQNDHFFVSGGALVYELISQQSLIPEASGTWYANYGRTRELFATFSRQGSFSQVQAGTQKGTCGTPAPEISIIPNPVNSLTLSYANALLSGSDFFSQYGAGFINATSHFDILEKPFVAMVSNSVDGLVHAVTANAPLSYTHTAPLPALGGTTFVPVGVKAFSTTYTNTPYSYLCSGVTVSGADEIFSYSGPSYGRIEDSHMDFDPQHLAFSSGIGNSHMGMCLYWPGFLVDGTCLVFAGRILASDQAAWLSNRADLAALATDSDEYEVKLAEQLALLTVIVNNGFSLKLVAEYAVPGQAYIVLSQEGF